jgi:ATP-dependent RNA helicase RhlE
MPGQVKFDVLDDLLKTAPFEKVIIFGRTKHGVDRLQKLLVARGHNAVSIHGDKPQHARDQALRQFKTDRAKILVATDVAARGIDVPDVSHVINFDQPATYDDYVHRIGRTGRADKKGHALTFV